MRTLVIWPSRPRVIDLDIRLYSRAQLIRSRFKCSVHSGPQIHSSIHSRAQSIGISVHAYLGVCVFVMCTTTSNSVVIERMRADVEEAPQLYIWGCVVAIASGRTKAADRPRILYPGHTHNMRVHYIFVQPSGRVIIIYAPIVGRPRALYGFSRSDADASDDAHTEGEGAADYRSMIGTQRERLKLPIIRFGC